LKVGKIAVIGLLTGLLIGVFMGFVICQPQAILRGFSAVQEYSGSGVVLKDLPKEYEAPKDLNTLINQLEELNIQYFYRGYIPGSGQRPYEVSYPLFLRMAYTSGFVVYDEGRDVKSGQGWIWVATLYDGVWFSCGLKTEAT